MTSTEKVEGKAERVIYADEINLNPIIFNDEGQAGTINMGNENLGLFLNI